MLIAINLTYICCVYKEKIVKNDSYFLWPESYFWKHSFLFEDFSIMKTTFSYVPGMFEHPATFVKTSCKRNVNFKTKSKISWNIDYYECVEKKSMIIGCNVWMICLVLNWFFYDPSRILQLSLNLWWHINRTNEWLN